MYKNIYINRFLHEYVLLKYFLDPVYIIRMWFDLYICRFIDIPVINQVID